MKKILLIVSLVVFGVSPLFSQTKLAHVNSQKLLDTLPSRKAAIIKLQEFETNGVKELKEMEDKSNNF